jgi:ribosomal protein L37AE/L43A
MTRSVKNIMEAEICRLTDDNLDRELSCAEAAGPEAAENAGLWTQLLRDEKERRSPNEHERMCNHPGGFRADTGEWECSRCGNRFPSYEAWGEATGNYEAVAAVKAAIATDLAQIDKS